MCARLHNPAEQAFQKMRFEQRYLKWASIIITSANSATPSTVVKRLGQGSSIFLEQFSLHISIFQLHEML